MTFSWKDFPATRFRQLNHLQIKSCSRSTNWQPQGQEEETSFHGAMLFTHHDHYHRFTKDDF